MTEEKMWQKCVDFHGHVCGGLAIGFKAALYAMELLELPADDGDGSRPVSSDEEVVCIAENDACGCDAIQVLLGCSVGKGNLLFRMRGKQAFSFYNRRTGRSVRLVLKPRPEGLERGQSLRYYMSREPAELFDVKEPKTAVPAEAMLFESYPCACCGEITASNWIRIRGGKMFCLDCYESYDRFSV